MQIVLVVAANGVPNLQLPRSDFDGNRCGNDVTAQTAAEQIRPTFVVNGGA